MSKHKDNNNNTKRSKSNTSSSSNKSDGEVKQVDPKVLVEANKASRNNIETLKKSKKAGCFYCLAIFKAAEVVGFCGQNSNNAKCPFCQVDSVIPDSSKYPVTIEFLQQMRSKWFNK